MTQLELVRELLFGMEAAVRDMLGSGSPRSRLGHGPIIEGWNRAVDLYCETPKDELRHTVLRNIAERYRDTFDRAVSQY